MDGDDVIAVPEGAVQAYAGALGCRKSRRLVDFHQLLTLERGQQRRDAGTRHLHGIGGRRVGERVVSGDEHVRIPFGLKNPGLAGSAAQHLGRDPAQALEDAGRIDQGDHLPSDAGECGRHLGLGVRVSLGGCERFLALPPLAAVTLRVPGDVDRGDEGEDHRDRRIRGRRGGQVERHRVPEDGETRDAHRGQLRPRTPRQEGRRRRGEDDEEERGRREVAGENAGRRGRDADLDRDREGDRNTPPPASGLAEHPEGPEDGAELHAFEGVERKELRAIERQLGQRKQDEREQQDPQPGSDASDE